MIIFTFTVTYQMKGNKKKMFCTVKYSGKFVSKYADFDQGK